jgi:hypothetical protein
LNEIGEEQEEAVRHQDFMRAQVLLEKMKELQEELQRLSAEPNVVHEQVETLYCTSLNSVWYFHIKQEMPSTHHGSELPICQSPFSLSSYQIGCSRIHHL